MLRAIHVSGLSFMYICVVDTHSLLQDAIECLNDPRRMPPLRWLNLISHSGGGSSSLSLYLAHRAEAASRECFLKFTAGYRKIRISVCWILVSLPYLGTEWSG